MGRICRFTLGVGTSGDTKIEVWTDWMTIDLPRAGFARLEYKEWAWHGIRPEWETVEDEILFWWTVIDGSMTPSVELAWIAGRLRELLWKALRLGERRPPTQGDQEDGFSRRSWFGTH